MRVTNCNIAWDPYGKDRNILILHISDGIYDWGPGWILLDQKVPVTWGYSFIEKYRLESNRGSYKALLPSYTEDQIFYLWACHTAIQEQL